VSSLRTLDSNGIWAPANRGPLLLAGDSSDIPMIRRILTALPTGSYGQVIVEVFNATQIQSLPATQHLGVNWLFREGQASHERTNAAALKGEPLARAIEAWLAEWMPTDEDTLGDRSLWIGARTNPRIERLCREIDRRFSRSA